MYGTSLPCWPSSEMVPRPEIVSVRGTVNDLVSVLEAFGATRLTRPLAIWKGVGNPPNPLNLVSGLRLATG
jgi:hypothetical protein